MSDNTLGIAVKILVSLMIIVIDGHQHPARLFGLESWTFIPLFLTLDRDCTGTGRFISPVIIIALIAASFFLSPMDISPVYALLNRGFFACMLIASAFLISELQRRAGRT